MKTKLHSQFIALALFAGVHQAIAQSPVISSFSQNGVLVCTNLQAGTVASVEWAPSLSGPWTNTWDGLNAVTAILVNAKSLLPYGMIQVSVPMFYRVRGVAIPTPTNNMVLVPAGSFTMGNSIGDSDITDADPTNVYVSAFYMDMCLVTYSQWQSVYNVATNIGYGFFVAGSGKGANYPVEVVDWLDTVKWCNARSQIAGLTPVYYTDAGLTQVYTNGMVDTNGMYIVPYANWTADGYRLPTEAEWEKAARGGLSGHRFPWGDTIAQWQADYEAYTGGFGYDLGPTGWYYEAQMGGEPYTLPATFAPNGYGLYDMAGNVREWCWDLYGTPYAGGTDPRGPAASNYGRVLRGGHWNCYADGVRCANRYYLYSGAFDWYSGFRCVMRVNSP